LTGTKQKIPGHEFIPSARKPVENFSLCPGKLDFLLGLTLPMLKLKTIKGSKLAD
jgi:hypothetical protein